MLNKLTGVIWFIPSKKISKKRTELRYLFFLYPPQIVKWKETRQDKMRQREKKKRQKKKKVCSQRDMEPKKITRSESVTTTPRRWLRNVSEWGALQMFYFEFRMCGLYLRPWTSRVKRFYVEEGHLESWQGMISFSSSLAPRLTRN